MSHIEIEITYKMFAARNLKRQTELTGNMLKSDSRLSSHKKIWDEHRR